MPQIFPFGLLVIFGLGLFDRDAESDARIINYTNNLDSKVCVTIFLK